MRSGCGHETTLECGRPGASAVLATGRVIASYNGDTFAARRDLGRSPDNMERPALGLIRFCGHVPKGGYDVQNGINEGRETGATTV